MRTIAYSLSIPVLLLAASPALAQEADASLSIGASSSAPPTATASADATAPGLAEPAPTFDPKTRAGFEVGLFVGAMFPPNAHDLQDDGADHFRLKNAAFEAGMRLAYLPIPYLGLELEGAALPSKTVDDDPSALWTVRAHALGQLPLGRITPFALIGGGGLGIASNSLGADVDEAFHFGAGAKFHIDDFLSVRLDVRDTLAHKNETPNMHLTHYPEILLGLGFHIGPEKKKKAEPPPPPPEPQCPTPVDSDKDGVEDGVDRCPLQAGPAPTGCPAPNDTDGDGFVDTADKCPSEKGVAPDGCPDLDADKDGIQLPDDKCPQAVENINGFEDTDGCPDQLPAEVQKFTGVIEGIEFDFALATIRPASRPTLDEAAATLNKNPTLRVRITGHTDNVGDRAQNVNLSRARAESVKQYLVSKGVAADRLEVVGAGPDQPRAPNDTPDGRQKNRRIEFQLITR